MFDCFQHNIGSVSAHTSLSRHFAICLWSDECTQTHGDCIIENTPEGYLAVLTYPEGGHADRRSVIYVVSVKMFHIVHMIRIINPPPVYAVKLRNAARVCPVSEHACGCI